MAPAAISQMRASLDQIVAFTRERVKHAKAAVDLRALERRAADHSSRGFRKQLLAASKSRPAIIAEIKKASPSRGVLRGDLNVPQMAAQLEEAGATALSILTEEKYFQGSLINLQQASSAVALPCLRKDFIVDEFQILEAKANQADAILLIVAAFLPHQDAELARLASLARELELDVLCEVHDESELRRAVDAGGAAMIGVNNRDLRTFNVDLECSLRLAPLIPAESLRVAESGIRSSGDMMKLQAAGYQGFLIGEALMTAADAGLALRELLAGHTAKAATLAERERVS